MTRSQWWAAGAGAGALLGLTLLSRALRPEGRLHVLNDQKFVEADPGGLARASGFSLDVYALASCMQSEEHSEAGRLAVGWATLNHCRRRKISPSALLLRAVRHGRRQPSHGRFGSQEAPGKWAATSKAPTAKTLQLAQSLMEGRTGSPDPTGGAEKWDAPAAQNRAHARDPMTYPKDAEDVAADRIAAGGQEIWVPGVPDTRFWKFA